MSPKGETDQTLAAVFCLITDATGASLLLTRNGQSWQLPRLYLPDFHEEAVDALNKAVATAWGVTVVVLRCRAEIGESSVGVGPGSVFDMVQVEPFTGAAPDMLMASARWFAVAALPEIIDAPAAFTEWLAERDPGQVPPARPDWARLGWWPRLTGWIRAEVTARGWSITGPIIQKRTWGISTVVQVPTTAGTLFAKATSPIFSSEALKTRDLSRLAPKQMPQLLALDPDQDWLLMMAADGPELASVSDLAAWKAALAAHSHLQLAAISPGNRLPSRFPDRRLRWLLARFQVILEDKGFLETYLEPAVAAALPMVASNLRARADELRSLGIPDTVVHGDFHGHNVIAGAAGPVFLDWSDACLGHPFLDQLLLMTRGERVKALTAVERRELLQARLLPWMAYSPLPTLTAAYLRAEPLVYLHQATAYYDILTGLEPGARWELDYGFSRFARRLLLYFGADAPHY